MEKLKARKLWNDIVKVVRGSNYQPRFVFSDKLLFENLFWAKAKMFYHLMFYHVLKRTTNDRLHKEGNWIHEEGMDKRNNDEQPHS